MRCAPSRFFAALAALGVHPIKSGTLSGHAFAAANRAAFGLGVLGPVTLASSLFGNPVQAEAAQNAQDATASIRWDQLDLSNVSTGWDRVKANASVESDTLSIGGQRFEHGVGLHAPSQAVFALDGSPLVFDAMVGVDDAPEQSGSVVFQAIADGKTVFDSGVRRQGDPPLPVHLDLTGVKQLQLVVTDAGDGKNFDHANWAEARFTAKQTGSLPNIEPTALWAVHLPHFDGDLQQLPGTLGNEQWHTSPDGKQAFAVAVVNQRLCLQVKGLPPMPLGVTVDGQDLGGPGTKLSKRAPAIETIQDQEAWYGNTNQRINHAKQHTFLLRTGSTPWQLVVHADRDGVAWRYEVPDGKHHTITAEATSFVLPEGVTYWSHRNTVNYEANFEPFVASGDQVSSQPLAMPITAELPDGRFVCFTEANMFGNSGMSLGPRGRALVALFEDDAQGWQTQTPGFVSPWRVVILAENLTDLVNQQIVYNVCPAPDPSIYPDGMRTDWIEPGRAYWTWGFGLWDSAKWEQIHGHIDDAAAMGCQFFTIDDPWRNPRMGWHRNGHDEWQSLKEVCDYAQSKGVKIMVWEHWSRLANLNDRIAFFDHVAEAGAVGVKIDFMDSESQDRLNFYESVLEIAAKRKIVVNFHGANKPAGERRTHPNLMTREAIYGLEQGAAVQRRHMAALPFTRLVVGPGDFTTTSFERGRMGQSTSACQVASSVVYNSPLHHWFDSAAHYQAQPAAVLRLIQTKPVTWDETRVLPGSAIGKRALVARRAGDAWYVAGINGQDHADTASIDLNFLGEGQWQATTIQDGGAANTDANRHSFAIETDAPAQATDTWSPTLLPGGGFVWVFEKQP